MKAFILPAAVIMTGLVAISGTDLEVSSIKVERDSVFIKVYENGPVTRARMTSDSTITGSRTWEGRTDIVELKKK